MINLPRSSYYYKSNKSKKNEVDECLLKNIHQILEEFPTYGKLRVYHELRRRGEAVNKKRVERVMQEHHLTQKMKRKFKVYTTDSNHEYPIYPNLTDGLEVKKANELWVSDITYIRLGSFFVYLAVILDSYSRKVIGYALSRQIDSKLTLAALEMAIHNRRPQAGCIHHSDRGVQYAAHVYIDRLKESGFKISMSRKGNPYDNAKAESFMKTLKYDEVYLSDYEDFDDVVKNVFEFIEEVYNKKRLHSSIGYLPPNEFEQINYQTVCLKEAV